jgi:alpha-D-xyloside xylohydrolase
MKQTNYHLFDFMDFDPSLQKDEALWKAYAPTKIEEREGDIIITIPYQKQLHQEDMAPDTSAAQQSFDLIIRAYKPNIVRLFTTMRGDEMTEADDMLMMAKEVKRLPLTVRSFPEGSVGYDVIAANGKKVAAIDLNAPVLDHWSDLLPVPQPAPFITF